MFRFSRHFQDTAELLSWQCWFQSHNIKTEVRKESEGFALYREGEEAIELRTMKNKKINQGTD